MFDLGGGTFDVSVLRIENGVFEVKATGGDTRLGGEDIDHTMVEFLYTEMDKQGFPDLKDDPRVRKRLMGAFEKAKRELSQVSSVDISIEALVPRNGDSPAKDFHYTLSRVDFERICKPLFSRCLETVKHVLKDASASIADVDDIVLVGGSTRIPKLQEMLSEFFGGKELCKTLNPDEAVAFGAGVQGAILSGKRASEIRDLLLLDVTPLSLGIETVGRVMSVIIPRNTSIPCQKTQVYTTEENNQTEVDISVYEGERPKTANNHFLGEFQISGIQKAKRGEPKIDVTFELDSNGILTVTAKDQKTGAKANIEIARGSRASDEEVEKMTAQAALYAAEDEENAKIMTTRNQLEEKIYSVQSAAESITNKHKEKREFLIKQCEETAEWLDSTDEEQLTVAALLAKIKALDQAVTKTRKEIG